MKGFIRFDLGIDLNALNNPQYIIDNKNIVSIDLFDTLIIRPPNLEQNLRQALSNKLVSYYASSGYTVSSVINILYTVEDNLRKIRKSNGFDPEIKRHAAYEQLLMQLGQRTDVEKKADQLIKWEIEYLSNIVKVNPVIAKLVETAKAIDLRVIAVSDMYYSTQELNSLLRKIKAPNIDKIYVSCEISFSKFRGGLFDHVIKQEKVNPDQILHIGDNRWSDIYSSRQKGIYSIHFRPKKFSDFCHDHRFNTNLGYQLGYETLGPVFAAFSHILLLHAAKSNIKKLAFIARDGDFLKQVTEHLALHASFLPKPDINYIFLSRRSTALPSINSLNEQALNKVAYIRSGDSLLKRFINYFGLSLYEISNLIQKYKLDINSESILPGHIKPLLNDLEFKQYVAAERLRQQKLLETYMQQQGLLDNHSSALVDIGWSGSIQSSLNKIFHGVSGPFPFRYVYFGYWTETQKVFNEYPENTYGIISDIRRGRTLMEGAAWYVAFILEALCRQECGTVTGYQESADSIVYAILAENSKSLDDEKKCAELRQPIRQGVLDYIENYSKYGCSIQIDENKERRKAQWRLLRLAFFPRRWEIDILSQLVHTEGHAETWSQPLVSQDRPNPLLSPRRWLAGLSSPWRFGYVAATGGYPLALLFMALEAGLLAAPPSIREKCRNLALGLVKKG